MKVALFGKSFIPEYLNHVVHLIHQLQHNDCELICEKNFASYLCGVYQNCFTFNGLFDKTDFISQSPDLLLSVGGDGTFLDTIGYVKDSGIPVLGINIGRLGFLANVAVEEVEDALNAIFTGAYTLEKRTLLSVQVTGVEHFISDFDYSLNEISIVKSETSSLLTIHASIDGDYLTSYWADGLVVATPTGSTAYSLSGGGPILTPECRNIILTPICPHNLNLRSLVIADDAKIELQVESREGDYILGMDARYFKLPDSCFLEIKRAPFYMNTIKLDNHNHYRTLRNKMMWGEDRRNR